MQEEATVRPPLDDEAEQEPAGTLGDLAYSAVQL